MMMRVVLVVAAALVLVSATPLQRDEANESTALHDLVAALQETSAAEKAGQQQLLASLQSIANTQLDIQRFLVGSNEIDLSGSSEDEEDVNGNMVYFTRRVVDALNAGNNTQLSEILSELKTLNTGFDQFFKKAKCPDPFVPVGEGCLNFQLEDLTWEESRQRCLRLGGDLAEPSNLTELRLYIGEHFPRKGRRNFWIGGVNNNKVWEWLSGSPVPPGYWYTNEPSGNGECLAMFDGWVHPLTDFPCENPRRAVCERKTN